MQTKKLLLGVLTGISVASLSIAGCTTQQDNVAVDSQQTPASTTAAQQEPVNNTQAQAPAPTTTTKPQERPADVPYVPTPQQVVDRMLQLGQVNKNDVVYDLGSGDGRIPITAAQKYGARGVGIDIDPERIQEANENARKAGVTDRVEFRQQDLFNTDLSEATVVTLYLLPDINVKLRPKLLKELKPGTLVVSHAFDMGEWKPERVEQVEGRTIYVWRIPKNPPANLL
ncbi:class I SAM-dependent methyltransferase [Chlorogloeopsis sp. ULAP01]|uniref:SAM-dependent methyltransferase n=1 Tax=Chlorogloeopsis sp. ULAP01 TaxID=3056483 RepID=UPI0025AAE62C|nr:class I SAM-dependent methyltransferase [Chlorogloeopsis sp. ULAP01]MDM9382021.1 class I SAM-dependent methyltransferase [Chlorogloeopsis sp. ULAP01]